MDIANSTDASMVFSPHSQFGLIEYAIFGTLLGLSALIGVYFGCVQRQNTVSDYLLGGRTMGIIPVALSNVASHISGIMLLGVPAEVYLYGTQHCLIAVTLISSTIIIVFCYIPVFCTLQINSVFQYLEMRFNSKVRTLGSFIFVFSQITYVSIVIYVPSLAINQVTGVSVHVTATAICIVCIFYTTLGGLKAVVWTDAMQSFFIAVSVISVLILGTNEIGGVGEVLRVAEEGHRLEFFNFNPDPFTRYTFWTQTLGTTFIWLCHFAVHPGSVQKFICVPTTRGAKTIMIVTCVCVIAMIGLTSYIGLLIFAKYRFCDPIASQMIQKSGQLLPLYVMEVAKNYPGLTGLFISGVVSASLSTMSACLNTVAGTLYEDLVAPFYKKSPKSDASASLIMKLIVLVVGVVCVLLVFVVERLGSILQMAMVVGSVTQGAMVYIFSVGMFFPWVNAKGALWGAVASMASMAFIVGGSQYYTLTGQLKFPSKIVSVDHCPLDIILNNSTAAVSTYVGVGSPVVAQDVPQLFQLSYVYFCALGSLVGLVVGLVVSHYTGSQDLHTLDPRLITPLLRRFLPANTSPIPRPDEELKDKRNSEIVITGV